MSFPDSDLIFVLHIALVAGRATRREGPILESRVI
jgi:hypothetical protein